MLFFSHLILFLHIYCYKNKYIKYSVESLKALLKCRWTNIEPCVLGVPLCLGVRACAFPCRWKCWCRVKMESSMQPWLPTWRVLWRRLSSCCQRASLKKSFSCRLLAFPMLVTDPFGYINSKKCETSSQLSIIHALCTCISVVQWLQTWCQRRMYKRNDEKLMSCKYITLNGKHVVCVTKGDFRMILGEDRSKVANIVKDNTEHFRILYSNILRDCSQVVYKPQQGKLEVKQVTHAQNTLLLLLECFTWYLSSTFYCEHYWCEIYSLNSSKQLFLN